MPVLPYCPDLAQDRKALYQFLLSCQQELVEPATQIVSIATEIDRVDPLAVLHELASPNQPHFYLEKGSDQAVAAIGSIAHLKTAGAQRFAQTQSFIQSCLERLTLFGPAPLDLPRFFCSFTFFDQPEPTDFCFPAAAVFLPQWQVIRSRQRCVAIANILLSSCSNIASLTEAIWQQFRQIQFAKFSLFNLPDAVRPALNAWQIADTHPFKSAVASALELIDRQRVNKLVVAHAIDVVARLPFQPVQSLHSLRVRHPDCYVFSTSSGGAQSFIGASPERLIEVRDSLLRTDALAGSAPRGQTVEQDARFAAQLLSSDKEQREHRVVVDFIRQRLSHFGLVPQSAPTPKLLKLSNIQHLHTPICAQMPQHLHPLDIVAELHPTPAVAGVPRAIACEQIRRHEAFERSLYAAPLGWIDAQGNAEFVVGIRSAAIAGNHARLYAGAGIVAGSGPDRELAEVKLKLQALLQALV